jgi:transcriptional regulator with XRE-family HTH domain
MTKSRLTDADREMGRRLRLMRIERGLSQTNLRDRVGITFQQIQKYENGSNRISAARLKEFAEILSAPLSYFFQMPKLATETEAKVFEYLHTENALRLVKAYSKIKTPAVRTAFVQLAESMTSEK